MRCRVTRFCKSCSTYLEFTPAASPQGKDRSAWHSFKPSPATFSAASRSDL